MGIFITKPNWQTQDANKPCRFIQAQINFFNDFSVYKQLCPFFILVKKENLRYFFAGDSYFFLVV